MTKHIMCILAGGVLLSTALLAQPVPPPHLKTNHNATQLMVKGKPFLVLGGELHNSSTASADYMRPIWERMKEKHLNTVIAPVYWELLEPEEGHFDFSLVDSMLTGARKQNLHLIILWFASWKNGYSLYPPAWIKTNSDKYPRAKDAQGNPVQQLSTFGKATMDADARAFKTLMQHIHDVDADQHTVIMAQIENEVGLFHAARDYRPEATKAFEGSVPQVLMDYMIQHKGALQPELESAWKAAGYKTRGSWTEVFGKSTFNDKDWHTLSYLTEELFTVYQYATYMGTVAAAGKSAYNIPMFVNAWIKQPGFAWPGKYPAGGPIPHTLDIWRAAAPAVDLIVPDIYINDAAYTMDQYHRPGNPLLIPEIRPGVRSANEAFLAFGHHDAIGIAPFGIDESAPTEDPITQTYQVLEQAQDFILAHQGDGTMVGFFLDTLHRQQEFDLGGYHITARLGSGSFAELAGFTVGERKTNLAGGLVVNTGKDEFVAIGRDYYLSFTPIHPDARKLDVLSIDQGTFVDGEWTSTHRWNGDEGTGGGDYGFGFSREGTVLLRFQPHASGEFSIIKFMMYRYW